MLYHKTGGGEQTLIPQPNTQGTQTEWILGVSNY